MNATLALPRIPAYCASKGGVVMLTKALAMAWAEEGIRVNAVAPGYIETAINAAGRTDRAHYQRIADRTAFKRWGQPEDIAGAVASSACLPRNMRPARWLRRRRFPCGMIDPNCQTYCVSGSWKTGRQ
jgi:NAD(P)-dependent dehydrogenase (short-subunit alcohol dehydrogenase family)